MVYELNNSGSGREHRLELTGRHRLTVSGVEDVERFDENCIVMATCAGTLIVTGEIADVTAALTEVVDYFRDTLGYVVCKITKR